MSSSIFSYVTGHLCIFLCQVTFKSPPHFFMEKTFKKLSFFNGNCFFFFSLTCLRYDKKLSCPVACGGLPAPGVEHSYSALAGRFLSTVPQGSPSNPLILSHLQFHVNFSITFSSYKILVEILVEFTLN